MVIRTNLSSNWREEAEMKGKGATEIEPKAGNREKGESCFLLTSLCPHGVECISRMAEKSGEVTTVFFSNSTCTALPSQAGRQDNSINRIKPYSSDQRKQVVTTAAATD